MTQKLKTATSLELQPSKQVDVMFRKFSLPEPARNSDIGLTGIYNRLLII